MKRIREIPRDIALPALSTTDRKQFENVFFHQDILLEHGVYDLIIVLGTSKQGLECAKTVDGILSKVRYKKIAFVGGIPDYFDSQPLRISEASNIYNKVRTKIPHSQVILEETSKNTKENMNLLNSACDLKAVHKILLISNNLHLYRAYLTLLNYVSTDSIVHRIGYIYRFYQFPNLRLTKKGWDKFNELKKRVGGEMARIIIYGKRGDLNITYAEKDLGRILTRFQKI